METSRNINIKKLDRINLNNLSQSFHEGIYSFSSDLSTLENNFPAAGIAGFLFINTDFDDKVCIQRITTMGRKFYFRTGNKEGSVFVWTDWDRYANIRDIPVKSLNDLEKDFITKEEFYPKDIGNLVTGTIDVEKEIDSTLQSLYKYYGKYNNESLYDICNLVNETPGIYNNKNKKFLLGYFIRDKDLEDNVRITEVNIPSKKAGLLQVFSSIYMSEVDQSISNSGIIDKGHIFRTFVFHEFETGDLFVTRTFMDRKPAIVDDRYYYNGKDRYTEDLVWDRYSYSKVRSYNLNKKSLDFLKIRNRQDSSIKLNGVNIVTSDYDNSRNEEYLKNLKNMSITPINKVISWNDDADSNIINDSSPIPYFSNTIRDNDFSIITSLSPTGTFFRYPKVWNSFIDPNNYQRSNNRHTNTYMVSPVWNTFNITYNVVKLTKDRFKSETIEKVD